jgi:class 3 adenylate cyclase/TolB-like protein/Tfp pilus assembly protein PilF
MSQLLATRRGSAAILAADVVGYSRLMEAAEEETHATLQGLRAQVLDPGVATQGGRVVKNTGDGFLAIFGRADDATHCAISLQRAVAAAMAPVPAERRVSFRMGLNFADIILEEDDVYGDGVNIAARLQTYAPPGGLIVSGSVVEQLGSEHGLGLIDLGDLTLRNRTQPVRLYELRTPSFASKLIGDAWLGTETRPSIAVLPFRMQPTIPEESYFATGVVDEIIHALASLRELFVVSHASVLGYGGLTIDVHAIGEQLGVRYVLYGSVRRSGGRLHIETQLSDAQTGTVIRPDVYEGDLADVFELQQRIVENVVRTVAPHVRERELVRARRTPPESLTAYDFLLQALDRLYRLDYESFSQARGLLQQAVAHDPLYALAHAYLAQWYGFRVGEMGSTEPVMDAAASIRHADLALELDSEDAQVLAICGHEYAYFTRDYRRAIDLFDRAIAAGPSLAMAWSMSSATRGFVGDAATAVRHAEQAVRLSPLDERLWWHEGLLAQAHYINGDFEEALDWVRFALERNGSARFNLRTLIASLVALGQMEEAAEVAQQLLRIQPDFRLSTYAQHCPFLEPTLGVWLDRLRLAGLSE